MLKEQLQKQIEQEGKSRKIGFENLVLATVADSEYCIGAEKYASLWQAAEEKAEKLEKALKEIQEEVVKAENESIFIDEFKLRKILAEALTPKTGEDE